jgi:hypothetical protein
MHLPYNILLILLPPTLALHLSLVHHPASALSPTTSLGHLVLPLLLISIFPSQISANGGIGIEQCESCLRDPKIGICGDPVCAGFITPTNAGSQRRVRGIFRENEVNEVNGIEGKEDRSYGDPSDYPNGAQESGADKGFRVPRVFAFPNMVLNAIYSGGEGILAAVVEKRELRVPRTITLTSPFPPNFSAFLSLYKTLDFSRRMVNTSVEKRQFILECSNWELLPRP